MPVFEKNIESASEIPLGLFVFRIVHTSQYKPCGNYSLLLCHDTFVINTSQIIINNNYVFQSAKEGFHYGRNKN